MGNAQGVDEKIAQRKLVNTIDDDYWWCGEGGCCGPWPDLPNDPKLGLRESKINRTMTDLGSTWIADTYQPVYALAKTSQAAPPSNSSSTIAVTSKPLESQTASTQITEEDKNAPVYITTQVENLQPIIRETDETTQTDVEKRENLAMTSPTVIFFPPAYVGGGEDKSGDGNSNNNVKAPSVGTKRGSVDTFSDRAFPSPPPTYKQSTKRRQDRGRRDRKGRRRRGRSSTTSSSYSSYSSSSSSTSSTSPDSHHRPFPPRFKNGAVKSSRPYPYAPRERQIKEEVEEINSIKIQGEDQVKVSSPKSKANDTAFASASMKNGKRHGTKDKGSSLYSGQNAPTPLSFLQRLLRKLSVNEGIQTDPQLEPAGTQTSNFDGGSLASTSLNPEGSKHSSTSSDSIPTYRSPHSINSTKHSSKSSKQGFDPTNKFPLKDVGTVRAKQPLASVRSRYMEPRHSHHAISGLPLLPAPNRARKTKLDRGSPPRRRRNQVTPPLPDSPVTEVEGRRLSEGMGLSALVHGFAPDAIFPFSYSKPRRPSTSEKKAYLSKLAQPFKENAPRARKTVNASRLANVALNKQVGPQKRQKSATEVPEAKKRSNMLPSFGGRTSTTPKGRKKRVSAVNQVVGTARQPVKRNVVRVPSMRPISNRIRSAEFDKAEDPVAFQPPDLSKAGIHVVRPQSRRGTSVYGRELPPTSKNFLVGKAAEPKYVFLNSQLKPAKKKITQNQ